MKGLCSRAKLYYSMRAALNVPYRDFRVGAKLSLPLKLKMWSKGFLSDKYFYYDLEKNNAKYYINDRQRAMTRFINEPYSEILNNKVIFEKIISPYAKAPKNYGIIDDNSFIPLDCNSVIPQEYNLCNSVKLLLEIYKMVVIKPVKGALGWGLYFIKYNDGEGYLVNNKSFSSKALGRLLSSIKCSVITEFIKQGKHPSTFYAGTTNTMRVITINPGNHMRPFIAAAARRVGTEMSSPMDNVARGGLTIEIDLDSGQLGSAAQLTKRGLVWHEYHPDSGAVIKGVYTSDWENIKKEIIDVISKLPFLKYVGWDIVESENGLVFIEGNNHPNVRVNQIHRPLLLDPRVIDFFRMHGLI